MIDNSRIKNVNAVCMHSIKIETEYINVQLHQANSDYKQADSQKHISILPEFSIAFIIFCAYAKFIV